MDTHTKTTTKWFVALAIQSHKYGYNILSTDSIFYCLYIFVTLIQEVNEAGEATHVNIITAAMTTRRNPTFRIFYFDTEMMEPLEFDTYFINISRAVGNCKILSSKTTLILLLNLKQLLLADLIFTQRIIIKHGLKLSVC